MFWKPGFTLKAYTFFFYFDIKSHSGIGRHGRRDCVPDELDPEMPYKTWKPEARILWYFLQNRRLDELVFLWWDSNLKEIEPHQRSNLQAQPKLMGTGEETVSLMGEKAKFNWTLMRWWRTKDMVTNPRWCLWRRTSTCRPSSSSPSLQSTQ